MQCKLKIDEEFQTLIPPLAQEELSTLEESILNEGCRDLLVIWKNIILDRGISVDIELNDFFTVNGYQKYLSFKFLRSKCVEKIVNVIDNYKMIFG